MTRGAFVSYGKSRDRRARLVRDQAHQHATTGTLGGRSEPLMASDLEMSQHELMLRLDGANTWW